MNKKFLLITSLFFLFFFTPITANAKNYYVILQDGAPMVDENNNMIRGDDVDLLTSGDIIYDPPNKYEVIKVSSGDDSYSHCVYCRCLENRENIDKEKGAISIRLRHYFNSSDYIFVSELDKKALDKCKNIKKMSVDLEEIPQWINKKAKKLSELTISAYWDNSIMIKKNAFANCKKLSTIELDYHCLLEKNSFKNVRATVYYQNAVRNYDKVKGPYYKPHKSISQIKKEMKKAGFKKGTIIKVWNGKNGAYFSRWSSRFKTIKL